jgi:biopolymer transport protein ExbB/TolQ
MSETQLLTIASALVAAMFGILCTIIAWIGSKAINSIDAMRDKLSEVAGELHDRINGLDRRVTVVETRCDNHHNN